MPNKKVAVVGMGPAGAFTSRAAYDMGYEVTIYQLGNTTTPPGAFWLHWLPEDLTGDFSSYPIKILGKGKPENYTKLQWGTYWYKGLTSSFPSEVVVEEGYDPAEVMPALVPDEVKIEIITYPLSDKDVDDLALGFDYVFQTFPRKAHIEEQPERLPFVAAAKYWGSPQPDKNIVVYNGTGEGITVREAYLFGHHFLEFPKAMPLQYIRQHYDLSGFQTVELKDLHPTTQPVGLSHPSGKIHLMGRYAQWDRRCLSHDCYHRTIGVLSHG